MFEPKNRTAETLPFNKIQVEHGGGTVECCPNGLIGCAIWAAEGIAPAIGDGRGLQPWSSLFNPLALEPKQGIVSDLSGREAVVYKADDIAVALAPDELLRFICHDLLPEEYFELRDRLGMFYEIHDDFYDVDTGAAQQPIRIGNQLVILLGPG